jgi:hypothetical protein
MKKTLNRFSNPDRRIFLFNKLKIWIDPIIRVLSFVAFGLFIYKIGFDSSVEKFQDVSFMLSLFLLSVGVLMLFKQIFLEKFSNLNLQ